MAGISIGAFVWKANGLPPADQPAAGLLIYDVKNSSLALPLVLTATLLWLAATLSVVVALRRRAPLPALVLLTVGALIFARGHAHP